ncbi:hypothetical protein D8674_017447 [Pyrus ussuriensis x Pyrus communis]|uniref:S-protein homolog n=1 Tax=Pyrus ussuriensis x Pyrus communis TaxID=2448454 RepID=A0A5N5HFV9_9ROSA|nr:hypothetical protein D8674_017447 [Pyrus ussuriensis x Pyrus communis]
MAFYIRNAFLLTVLVLFLSITCEAGILPHKRNINSTNDVGAELAIHCKSKNDDLGAQAIPDKGSYFWCSFAWGSEFHYFDIYIHKRDDWLCNYCPWIIKPTGPCMWNYDTNAWDICSKWNERIRLKLY